MQQLTTISNQQRQHLSCTVNMVTDASIGHIYYEDSLSAWEIQRYQKDNYIHPFGINISTDIVFGILVPESTAGSIKIPNFIRYSQLC